MEFPEQTAPSRKDNKIPRLDGTVHEKIREFSGGVELKSVDQSRVLKTGFEEATYL